METFFEANLFLNQDYKLTNFSYNGVTVSLYALISNVSDFDLTGQIIWPAATLLSEYLIDNKLLIQDKRVLELGAGAGLSGFVASEFAKSIFITDGNEIVLDLLKKNKDFSKKTNVFIEKLEWKEGKDSWVVENNAFDYVIGADILFWPDSIAPLVDTLEALRAKNKDLKIIIALCKRSLHSEKIFDDCLNRIKLKRVIVKEQRNEFIYEILPISE